MVRSSRSKVEKKDLVFADALIENPREIVTAARATVDEAKKQGAPKPVLNALDDAVERLEAGAKRMDRLDYTLKSVKRLKGMRDRFELEPELERAWQTPLTTTTVRGSRRCCARSAGRPATTSGFPVACSRMTMTMTTGATGFAAGSLASCALRRASSAVDSPVCSADQYRATFDLALGCRTASRSIACFQYLSRVAGGATWHGRRLRQHRGWNRLHRRSASLTRRSASLTRVA